MSRSLVAVLVAGLLLAQWTIVFSAESSGDAALGEKLVHKVFADAKAGDVNALKKLISGISISAS